MQRIGFIGTGVMGTGIINNLLGAGYEVTVYNRTKAHAQAVLDRGARWGETPAKVAADTLIPSWPRYDLVHPYKWLRKVLQAKTQSRSASAFIDAGLHTVCD